jgi:hypothetical protein
MVDVMKSFGVCTSGSRKRGSTGFAEQVLADRIEHGESQAVGIQISLPAAA